MKYSRQGTVAPVTSGKPKKISQAKKENVAADLRRVEAFRDNFSASMKEAAKQAKVKLLNDEVSVAVRGDFVIANALIAPPKNVPIEEADRLFFVYLSFPAKHVFAKKIPSGFYAIERMAKQKNPRAKVVNLEGKTVLELPLNVRKIETTAEEWDTQEKLAVAQATIEQAHETLYQSTRIQAHGVLCYPRDGVWYWIWA